MDKLTEVLALREAGNVQRCHGLPHHGEYSNAHHSWNAAMLLLRLYPEHLKVPRRLLLGVMLHDSAERWVGDLPSPALARWPELGKAYVAAEAEVHTALLGFRPEADLPPEDFIWLKAVDRLELLLWCWDQLNLGNQGAKAWITHLEPLLLNQPTPREVTDFVLGFKWRRTNNTEITG